MSKQEGQLHCADIDAQRSRIMTEVWTVACSLTWSSALYNRSPWLWISWWAHKHIRVLDPTAAQHRMEIRMIVLIPGHDRKSVCNSVFTHLYYHAALSSSGGGLQAVECGHGALLISGWVALGETRAASWECYSYLIKKLLSTGCLIASCFAIDQDVVTMRPRSTLLLTYKSRSKIILGGPRWQGGVAAWVWRSVPANKLTTNLGSTLDDLNILHLIMQSKPLLSQIQEPGRKEFGCDGSNFQSWVPILLWTFSISCSPARGSIQDSSWRRADVLQWHVKLELGLGNYDDRLARGKRKINPR